LFLISGALVGITDYIVNKKFTFLTTSIAEKSLQIYNFELTMLLLRLRRLL
jgi:hypothetical protein